MTSAGAQIPTATIQRLVGVYNANGSLAGEFAYFVGARLGRAHCALCDITHGLAREKAEWKACRSGLAVPFDTYHLNDQPHTVRATAHGEAPVVLAETDTAMVVLLGPRELDACRGSVDRLAEAITAAVDARGLRFSWPARRDPS
jgi:hypothetical protein